MRRHDPVPSDQKNKTLRFTRHDSQEQYTMIDSIFIHSQTFSAENKLPMHRAARGAPIVQGQVLAHFCALQQMVKFIDTWESYGTNLESYWFLVVFFPHPLSHRFPIRNSQPIPGFDTGLHGLQLRVQALDALPAALPAWQSSGQVVLQLRLPVVALGLRGTSHGDVSIQVAQLDHNYPQVMGFHGIVERFLMFYKTTQKTWRQLLSNALHGMEELLQLGWLKDVETFWNPTNNGISHLSTAAAFLPSALLWDVSSQVPNMRAIGL